MKRETGTATVMTVYTAYTILSFIQPATHDCFLLYKLYYIF